MKPYPLTIVLFFLFASVLACPALGKDGNSPAITPRKGVYRTYRFTYSDENTTTIFPDRLGRKGGRASTYMSSLSFDGDLREKDYGMVGGERIFSLSFDAVRTSRFAMNGHAVFENPEQFIGKYRNFEMFVSVDGSNRITRFLFPDKTPQVFKTFMITTAQEIQVTIEQGKKNWSAGEVTQHGKGKMDYRVTGMKKNRVEIEKTAKNYDYPGLIAPTDRQSVDLREKVTLSREGFVENIDKKEKTTVTSPANRQTILDVKKEMKLSMTGRGTFDPGAFGPERLKTMLPVYPGESAPDPSENRRLLAEQASDLLYEDIENWIGSFKPDPKDNRANNAMFYKSAGFLKLQPKSAERIAAFARKKERTSGERTLAMNLLAAAGTENAQSAMRAVLSDPEVRKDPQYGVFIQNFSFMDVKPAQGTVEFLSNMMTGKKGYESYAAAHAFGACIHKFYTRSEKERALALNKRILMKIDAAATPDERAEYIGALGNAGMFENNRVLLSYFSDPVPRIRAEAAMALRKTETAEVREKVTGLFKDNDRGVQRSAIQTSMQFNTDEKNLRDVRNQLKRGLIQEANYYDLTSLLKKNRERYPALMKDCLKLMVRKKLKDPDLEARIRGMF
jgi:hypothetical protein